MTPRDREALELAIERCRAESAGRAEQLEAMLTERPWREVAEFAAYSMQMKSLRLRPWQWPPCWARVDDRGHPEAAKLLRDMRAAGVSRFHPDPLQALRQSERWVR